MTTPAVPVATAVDAEILAVRALARAARLLERSCEDLSLQHYRVLAAIGSGEARASRVAARLAVGKPAISAAVESLCQRGLVARDVVAADQRATTLTLTADGAALLARNEAVMVARLRELAMRTPDGPRLLETLGWLGAAIEESLR